MRDKSGVSLTLARLHAALDSVETTRSLVAEVQKSEPFRGESAQLRGVAELVGRARDLLRSAIAVEAA